MLITIIISGFFLFISGYLILTFKKGESEPLAIPVFLMIACIPWITYNENQEELNNKETCKELGTVEDVVYTANMTTGKNSYGYSKCRVKLNDGSKHNLNEHLMALKGDKISYCTNSIKRFQSKNHYKVD